MRSELNSGSVMGTTNYETAAKPIPRDEFLDAATGTSGETWRESRSRQTLHGLFELQVRRTPTAMAVACGDRQLTYRELDQRAQALARRLRRCGVQRGALVGLCVERSLDLAVGLLGILKAGAAYVPLDPVYPAERLAFMLADTEILVLVTQTGLKDHLPATQAQVIYLDEASQYEATLGNDSACPEIDGGDLAYVMYTSGSTGKPKGVMVEHGAALNTVVDINRRFGVGPNDRVLALSSYGFDLSVFDTFGLWAAGGAIVMPEAASTSQPAHWAQQLNRHQVTIWNSVPASMGMLLAHESGRHEGSLDSVRLVLLSGDVLPSTLPDRVRAFNARAEIVNVYGITEASIWSTVYSVGSSAADRGSVSIGKALANQSIDILNDDLTACPPGEVGQLYIGGAGLARGYWRRPELTAERFIRNPLSNDPTARLYVTGDLGRLRDDGNIEFLGRGDGQVKIRGYRVELGEVEAALARHPGIRQAVVLAKESLDHKQLAAFIVPAAQPAPTARDLRRFLRETLPEYMIPSHFAMRDSLPLTPNNKVDRQALAGGQRPQPNAPAPSRATETEAPPRSEIERRLVSILREGFDLDTLGIDDNFFDLDGDSLVAAGLFAKIEQEFWQTLSLDVLFERPTIRLLAELLENPAAVPARSAVVTIQAGDARRPLFCLPGIGGNVLEFQALARLFGPAQPLYGLPPVGLDDDQTPHRTISEMAAHAIQQIRKIQEQGPYHLLGYSLGGIVAFEMAQQLQEAGETTDLLALLDSRLWSPPITLSTFQKLKLHWKNLLHSSNRGRLHYLRERWRLLKGRIRRGNLSQAEGDLVVGLDLSPSSRKVAEVHWQAWRSYQPRIYDGEISLFVAQQHPVLSAAVNGDDRTLGWERWTSKPVAVYPTTGTHAEILRRGELQVLAAQLGASESGARTNNICV